MTSGNKQPGSVIAALSGPVSKISGWLPGGNGFFDYSSDIISLAKPDYGIDTGDLAEKLSAQSLRQTASDNYFLNPPGRAELAVHRVSYCFERFSLGWLDKTAGIDNYNVSIIGLGGYQKACLNNLG